ncbi:hypothetical protein M413DRAFT_295794 [Hebeloma cylindrosporum]|uniref:CcmS related domain-containing protein n=1 Tax=Hebeloma cylindrosporum TaxID=76867 RepID=A0A0C2YY16_HEBCY|nr:hypothetical protein M413DRAFT_295794 [Hebeloma cylindrosporum h7]
MGSPAAAPMISLAEAAANAQKQKQTQNNPTSSASQAAKKLEESRARTVEFVTAAQSSAVSAVGPHDAAKAKAPTPANRQPLSTASAAAAAFEANMIGKRKEAQSSANATPSGSQQPKGRTWTDSKPGAREPTTIEVDYSWTRTGGNAWSNKYRLDLPKTAQGAVNGWNKPLQHVQQQQQQQQQQKQQAHQHHRAQHPHQTQHRQHPPQHQRHHSVPVHATHQAQPQQNPAAAWQGWGREGVDQMQGTYNDSDEETMQGWNTYQGGDGWGQSSSGWNAQQPAGKHDKSHGQRRKSEDHRGQAQAHGWGQQQQPAKDTWGHQTNDGWGQDQWGGAGDGWGKEGGDGWGQGGGGSADGWGQAGGDGWGQQAETGWGNTPEHGWGNQGEGAGRASLNNEWGGTAQAKNNHAAQLAAAAHAAQMTAAAKYQAQVKAQQGHHQGHHQGHPQERRDAWEAEESSDGWGSDEDEEGEYSRRVHFSPKWSEVWGGSPRSIPTKALAHAHAQQGIKTTLINDASNVRFAESKGAAFAYVANAFFGNARLARERIHWLFPPNKDKRVAEMLAWVQKMSFNLGTYGLVKFLETRERGALFINVAFRMRQYPQEPAIDWLTFSNLQGTMDKILQESAAFYDPAALVTVFVYLPSQTGNSVAIWRRKINVPEKARNQYRAELNAIVKTLPPPKDYIIMVDELPKPKPKPQTSQKPGQLRKSMPAKTAAKSPTTTYTQHNAKNTAKTKDAKKKRKWWKFFLS